jgi:hypothetical protein
VYTNLSARTVILMQAKQRRFKVFTSPARLRPRAHTLCPHPFDAAITKRKRKPTSCALLFFGQANARAITSKDEVIKKSTGICVFAKIAHVPPHMYLHDTHTQSHP